MSETSQPSLRDQIAEVFGACTFDMTDIQVADAVLAIPAIARLAHPADERARDRFGRLADATTKIAQKLAEAEAEVARLKAENERLTRIGEVPLLQAELAEHQRLATYWEEEARRYAGNADYWRERTKVGEAERDRLRTLLRDAHYLAIHGERQTHPHETWAAWVGAYVAEVQSVRKCPMCGRLTPGLVKEDDLCPPCDLQLAKDVALEYREERDQLRKAVEDVRRLCDLTIASSCRVQAIDQARDTLAVLDRALADGTTRTDTEHPGSET